MSQDLVQADTLLEAKARREELLAFRQLVNQYIDQHIKDLDSIIDGGKKTADRMADEGAFEKRVASLPWKAKDSSFSWSFNTDRQGAQLKETKELADAIDHANGKLLLGGHGYTLSNDRKFLQRVKHKGVQGGA